MKISVFGLGYVGTICAACLADRGHDVIGLDKLESKVDLIRSGRSPIIERDIEDLIKRTIKTGRLTATMDVTEAIARERINVTAVNTLSRGAIAFMRFTVQVGSADAIARVLRQVKDVPGVDAARRL